MRSPQSGGGGEVAGDAKENGGPLQIVRIPDLEGGLFPTVHKSAAFSAKLIY